MKIDLNSAFEEAIMKQLVQGYTVVDQWGNDTIKNSPIQQILTQYVNDNKNSISEVMKEIITDDILKEQIKIIISERLKNEYWLKGIMDTWSNSIRDKIQTEIVKNMGFIFENKTITISINDIQTNLPTNQ